jgi:hypothetical protein
MKDISRWLFLGPFTSNDRNDLSIFFRKHLKRFFGSLPHILVIIYQNRLKLFASVKPLKISPFYLENSIIPFKVFKLKNKLIK